MSISTTGSLNNIFNINQVALSVTNDVRFSIMKHREFVVYKTLSDIDSTNLAYLINPALFSDENIFVSKKADELSANNLPKESSAIVFSGKTININVDKFLSTDRFLTSDNGQRVPLYFMHVLGHFNSSNTNLILLDVVILDSSLKKIAIEESDFDYQNGIVYNNIRNTFDFKSGDYDIKYIRYTVKDSSSNIINSYLEIVNNQTVYRQATFDDLLPDGTLPSNLKIYVLEKDTITNTFEVTFPSLQIYAILESSDSRLHVIKPINLNSNTPWLCSLTNGNFVTSLKTSFFTSNIFGYNVPEFNTQAFFPFAPFKYKGAENSEFINNKTIKTLKNNIQFDISNDFHIFVVGRGVDGIARYALSTDVSLNGSTFEDVIITNQIRSIDSMNGMIDVTVNILESDTLEVSYYYEEKEYEIVDIDFNPILNADIVGKRVVFYLVPNTTDTRFKTLYYLFVDNKGIITFTSQQDNTGLLTDIGTNIFKYDIPSPAASNLNFLDKYTLQASTAYQFANITNPRYFVLSEVSTSDIKHADQSTIIDIRREGGGIKDLPGLFEGLAHIVPELQWITNKIPLDGYQYPKNGSTYIEVPTSIQKDYGGNFSDIQLRSIVERHTGFGIYPILRGYNTNVICIAEPITDNTNAVSIKLDWRSYGTGKTYNIYYSLFPDHGFIKANISPIANNLAGNTYTISTGLATNKKYWVYVVYCDTINDYPQTIIGTDSNHTYELLNKVEVQTYVFPT
jgi:hypothetical protein